MCVTSLDINTAQIKISCSLALSLSFYVYVCVHVCPYASFNFIYSCLMILLTFFVKCCYSTNLYLNKLRYYMLICHFKRAKCPNLTETKRYQTFFDRFCSHFSKYAASLCQFQWHFEPHKWQQRLWCYCARSEITD